MITKTHIRARRCTYCNIKIPKDEKHLRFQHTVGMRGSCTVNICAECIEQALGEIGKGELKEIKIRNAKERVLNRLK